MVSEVRAVEHGADLLLSIFMAWSLIKHSDGFAILPLPLTVCGPLYQEGTAEKGWLSKSRTCYRMLLRASDFDRFL
jgi:hypothetical protein